MPAKLTPREARHKLDADVSQAQRDAIAPGRAESEGQRAKRLGKDRAAVDERNAAVQAAQEAQGKRAEETEAERAARIEADKAAVLERQAAVVAAVDAENAARAKALADA